MSGKIKLAIISGFYPRFTGGAEYQMRLIADQLKHDFEIVFIYLGDIPGKAVLKTEVQYIEGYKVYFIKSANKFDAFVLRFFYAKRLKRIFKKERPDFVYQRVLKFVSYYISKFQKDIGYKHLIHIADLFTIQFPKRTIRERFNYFVFKQTVKNSPQFIVQTNEQLTLLQQYNVTPSLQVYNLHPSIDESIISFVENKIQTDQKVIVWIGNIRPIKQLEVFLELAESYQDFKDYKFVVIGGVHSSEYADILLKKMDELQNVEFITNKENDFINQYILEKANVVVNTSSTEGLSNVFIQSWMRGVPVLSLNSNPDYLFTKYPEFGFFCNNDEKLLFSSLELVLKDENYKENGIKSFNNSEKMFSLKNIKKIKQLLKK